MKKKFRLERNQEREKSISNMEYLKNVVFKFLTFTSQQEKAQLLPVLSTMLKLSQDEQNEIMNVKGIYFFTHLRLLFKEKKKKINSKIYIALMSFDI